MLTFRDNPYQYTRAVRFRAEPQQQSECFQERTSHEHGKPDLSGLAGLLLEIHGNLQKLFYVQDKNGKLILSKKLSVNKTWLKLWHKNTFYLRIKDQHNKQGKYALKDLMELHDDLKSWLENWKNHADYLKDASGRPQNDQSRRSDIANTINMLLNRRTLAYIKDFLLEAHAKDARSDENIEGLKTALDQVEDKLKNAEQYYLPSQSSGIEIAKASFNLYTVNKKPQDYATRLKTVKHKLESDSFSAITKNKNGDYLWKNGGRDIFTFKSEQEKKWITRYTAQHNDKLKGDLETGLSLSLDQTYAAMKSFKAEQKSIFDEVMTHVANDQGSSYRVNNEKHLLKDYEFSYETLNQDGINEAFSLFIFKSDKSDKSEEKYKEHEKFCEHYKKVAQQRGRLIAQIKGIEKEKQDAMQTSYWSLIYVEDNRKQLWLVPKDRMQDAKKFIYNSHGRKNYQAGSSKYLCCFESLTMRALHKLCFAEQSSFVEGMPDNLKQLQQDVKEFKTDGDEHKISQKNRKKLDFFQKLMASDHLQNTLQLENFNLTSIREAESLESLEEFETVLENICYHVKRIVIKEDEKQHFLDKFNVTALNVASYDLERRNKNTHQTPASENKYHTDLWQAFWNSVDQPDDNTNVKGFTIGKVRLNPEVKIRYRKADPELKKYFDKKQFDKSFRHRNLKDQFTITFTLALNAGKRYEELAFSEPEKILEKIEDFNQKLNKDRDFKTAWKYGIDRGNIELATLCLAKFDPDKDTYQENNKTIVKPGFPDGDEDIKCYELKNYKYNERYTDSKGQKKTREAIKNLSYFIDQEGLFTTKSVTCLDLTTAKVIRGKIVANGDVMTYLKLKKTVAKRRLYDLYHAGKIDANAQLKCSKKENGKESEDRPQGVLNIKTEKGEKTIYWFLNKYKDIFSEETIKQNLNRYLSEIRNKNHHHTPAILQINHLRDAITANMVGVICHLQKKYPGFVLLEDLRQSVVDEHFFKHNENISRRLENALYNKFQALGLVPPHVKDAISLREKIREEQYKPFRINLEEKAKSHYKKHKKKKDYQGKSSEDGIALSKEKLQDELENKFRKETKLSHQIGAIVFVDEYGTSVECPHCEEKQNRSQSEKNDEKLRQRRFICGPCGFDTHRFKEEREQDYKPEVIDSCKEKFNLLKEIDDPDKVAAYNIAKKITDPKKIRPMRFPEESNEQGNRTGAKRGKSKHKKQQRNTRAQNSSRGSTHKPFQTLRNDLKKKQNS